MVDRAIMKNIRIVAADSDHSLHSYFHVLPSGDMYWCMKSKRVRYSRGFVPGAIRILNE